MLLRIRHIILNHHTLVQRVRAGVLSILLLGLVACGGQKGADYTYPKAGHYKVGKPYKIKGEWYHPKEQPNYDEAGIASWYGPGFHGKKTANGAIYNQNALTAAHKTLPLPSMVRVTNLENGRSLVLMVNDRGPFANERIIDVSERAARLLNFKDQGTAHVRVQFLPQQTEKLLAKRAKKKISKTPLPPTFAGGSSVPETPVVSPRYVNDYRKAKATQSLHAPRNYNQAAQKHLGYRPSVSPPPVALRHSPVPPVPTPAVVPPPVRVEPVRHVSTMAPSVRSNPAMAGGSAFIQAGAFQVKRSAYKVAGQLAQLGDVDVTEVQKGATTLYRVRLGPVKQPQATALLSRVKALGHPGARLVSDR